MLTIHHLGLSQSERIVWLCEELDIPYTLQHYTRDAVTRLAPPELAQVHPLGNAPVITDDGMVLAESAAIVDYLLALHGKGRLVLSVGHPDFAPFLYWFHFANGNLQPLMSRNMTLSRLQLAEDNPMLLNIRARLERALALMEKRLGEGPWLAGAEFTVADVMSVFSLTTMRLFYPLDLAPYPHILAWLARVGGREAYRRAMAKGDPGFVPMLK
jgi:glutathione S-transferase